MDAIPPGTDLSQIPAGTPPPGVVPDFIDPESLAPTTIAVGTVVSVFTFVFVILRVFANTSGTNRLGWSDYFCIAGTVVAFGYTVLITYISDYARHDWDTPLSWYTADYFKILFASAFLLNFSIFLAKNAMLLLYLRLFSVNKALKWAIYGGIAFTVPLYWIQIGLLGKFCAPEPYQPWDLTVGQKCSRTIVWGVVQGVLNVCLDIYMLILPVPAILGLHLSKRRKMGVLAIFGTALFALISAIMAMVFRVKLFRSDDVSWTQSQLYICVICETNVVIMCSCMPAMASFWRSHGATLFSSMSSLRSRLLSSKSSSGSGSGSGSGPGSGPGSHPSSAQTEAKHSPSSPSPIPSKYQAYVMHKSSGSGGSGLPIYKNVDLESHSDSELGIKKSVIIDQAYRGRQSP